MSCLLNETNASIIVNITIFGNLQPTKYLCRILTYASMMHGQHVRSIAVAEAQVLQCANYGILIFVYDFITYNSFWWQSVIYKMARKTNEEGRLDDQGIALETSHVLGYCASCLGTLFLRTSKEGKCSESRRHR